MTAPAHPASMMRDREIWTFLVSIVLANAVFVYAISEHWLPPGLYNLGRFLLLGAVLVAVVFLFRGWKAPFGLLKPLTVWRIHPVWFVMALAWPPAIAVLTLTAKDLILGTGPSVSDATLSVVLHPKLLPTLLIAAFVGEIVWVGYAIARLRNWTTTLAASLIVGMFWSLWWTPLVIINVGVVHGIPLPAVFINMFGVAVMCGFVYGHTRSGLAVFALQVSFNSTLLIFPIIPETGGVSTFVAFTSLYLFSSLLLHLGFGPRPLLPAAVRV